MVPITLYPQCRKYNGKKQTAEIKEAKDSLILISFSQHLKKSHFYIKIFFLIKQSILVNFILFGLHIF